MINACVIGLSGRGCESLLKNVLLKNKDINVVSVCDIYQDRIDNALKLIKDNGGDAKGFTDYKDALNMKGIEAAFVFTGWESHAEIAMYAMEKGIPVASEVGCEYSIENCQKLVRTHEKTGTPYMFMENCCYGQDELFATSMVRHGAFGTIVHCSGAYAHDLRQEISYGLKNRHYRFKNYLYRNLDNYPTHELGPIAKILNINRGNKILTVSSFASKSAGLRDYIESLPDASDEMKEAMFKQGDIVTSVLTCAGGETITLRLDTTLPRTYSREFTVRGTKGMYSQDTNSVFLDGDKELFNPIEYYKDNLDNAQKYYDKYLPEIWKNVSTEELKAGHGGMDYFAYKAFSDAVINKTEMPIDVYDGVTWMAVAVLSEMSIALGGAPQAMPDFTNGKWFHRKPCDVCEF